jgi:hypothetical protein
MLNNTILIIQVIMKVIIMEIIVKLKVIQTKNKKTFKLTDKKIINGKVRNTIINTIQM